MWNDIKQARKRLVDAGYVIDLEKEFILGPKGGVYSKTPWKEVYNRETRKDEFVIG